MEQHGVEVTKEEEARLADLDEMQMIDALISKMPSQSSEEFQRFFLQLQQIVSTATRVRTALEDGRPDMVEQVLNEADNTGIAQHILKMSLVQAGSEVASMRRLHEAWVKDTESKMSKLLRGQDDAIQAQKKLAQAQAQLAEFQGNHNEKAKKVLMGMCSGNTQALIKSTFVAWHGHA